jgi:hypothetical protein
MAQIQLCLKVRQLLQREENVLERRMWRGHEAVRCTSLGLIQIGTEISVCLHIRQCSERNYVEVQECGHAHKIASYFECDIQHDMATVSVT